MKAYDLSQLRVTIVEDDRQMRAILAACLNAFGVTDIQVCADGKEALGRLWLFPTDIVLTDWEMKPMSGIELVHALRDETTSPRPDVPIIMITGHTQAEKVLEARDSGVTLFLAKPIAPHALYARLVHLVEQSGDGPERPARSSAPRSWLAHIAGAASGRAR
ncbi:MAG TPA: response regulator [Alphaproteobacteria bacterium]|nr:response regulator [Alphaproteobacteria bacterium]